MKIYAPVKDTNGVKASVRFVNGVGETNDPHLIKWFETHGYRVEKCEIDPPITVEKCDDVLLTLLEQCEEVEDEMMGYGETQPDFESMTPNELREWAKANGFGSKIKSIRSKEKLLEVIRG